MMVRATNGYPRGDEAAGESRPVGVVERAGRRNAYLTIVTRAEMLFGDRVPPFDTDAAHHYAALAVAARNAGRGSPTPDGHIAAIAASRGFTVASLETSAHEAAKVPATAR